MARMRKYGKAASGFIPVILAVGAVFILYRLVTTAQPASASEAGYSTSQGGGGGDSAVPAPATNGGLLDSISSGIDRILNRRPPSQTPAPPTAPQIHNINLPRAAYQPYGGPNPHYNNNARAQNPRTTQTNLDGAAPPQTHAPASTPRRNVRSHLSPRTKQALERNTVRTGTAGIPITQTAARVQQLESRGHSGFRDATIISRQRSAAAQQRQAAQQPAPPSRARTNQFQRDLLSRVRQARR